MRPGPTATTEASVSEGRLDHHELADAIRRHEPGELTVEGLRGTEGPPGGGTPPPPGSTHACGEKALERMSVPFSFFQSPSPHFPRPFPPVRARLPGRSR